MGRTCVLTVAKLSRMASGVKGGVKTPLAPCSNVAAATFPVRSSLAEYAV